MTLVHAIIFSRFDSISPVKDQYSLKKEAVIRQIKNLKSRNTNNIAEENKMKNKPKGEGEKLLCPKACVQNQLDDDRHSDTVVLETKKAIDLTLRMPTN